MYAWNVACSFILYMSKNRAFMRKHDHVHAFEHDVSHVPLLSELCPAWAMQRARPRHTMSHEQSLRIKNQLKTEHDEICQALQAPENDVRSRPERKDTPFKPNQDIVRNEVSARPGWMHLRKQVKRKLPTEYLWSIFGLTKSGNPFEAHAMANLQEIMYLIKKRHTSVCWARRCAANRRQNKKSRTKKLFHQDFERCTGQKTTTLNLHQRFQDKHVLCRRKNTACNLSVNHFSRASKSAECKILFPKTTWDRTRLRTCCFSAIQCWKKHDIQTS